MSKKLGVGAQLVAAFVLVSALAVGIQTMVTSSMVSKASTEEALNLLLEISSGYSDQVQNYLEKGFVMAADGRGLIAAAKKQAERREQPLAREDLYIGLESLLLENPWALAIWTVWEPNAFDGRDADYAGQAGHDASGRVVPYFTLNNGRVNSEPLVGYDKPGEGDYYLIALNSRKPAMVEPYEYKVDGKTSFITSMAMPIEANNRAVGVVGADLSLDYISRLTSGLRPLEVGRPFWSLPEAWWPGTQTSPRWGGSLQRPTWAG